MLRNKTVKITIIILAIIVALGLVAITTYSILVRITPMKDQESSEINGIKDKSAAEKVYTDAANADRIQDFDKAIEQYNKILPFYKEAAKTSVTDQNTVWQIETRIAAIEKDKKDLQQMLDDQANQNPNVRTLPEGEGSKPDNDTIEY